MPKAHGFDWRAIKKNDNQFVSMVHQAYLQGEDARYFNRTKRNPYPKGRRHDAYERGYTLKDREAEC